MSSDRLLLYVGGLLFLLLLATLRLFLPASHAGPEAGLTERTTQTNVGEGARVPTASPPTGPVIAPTVDPDREPFPVFDESLLGELGAFRRGMVFGLFPYGNEEPRFVSEFQELHSLGVNAIVLNFNWYMDTIRDGTVFRGIADQNNQTPTDAIIRQAIEDAHDQDLHVMLFPSIYILNLGRREWRGRIAPPDWDTWFDAYRALVVSLARLAEDTGTEELCIGVELISTEQFEDQWRRIIREVRAIYSGKILYSCNWDARARYSWLGETDLLAMNAYYELSSDREASIDEMTERWREIRDEIAPWREHFGLPLVITEIGYRSADGTATAPWNYYLRGGLDLEEQRRCYEAFFRAWFEDDLFNGVYWYTWFGEGGPLDMSYTPRGKPAAIEMTQWYRRYAERDAARATAAADAAVAQESSETGSESESE